MKIKNKNNDPYFEEIKQYLYQEFPAVALLTDCELVDILANIIVGTKEIRYGSLPSPESLVVIRQTIRESIANNIAIPILVPWGSMKVGGSNYLDVAEISAINRLTSLLSLIKEFYTPGLDIVIRVEDTSGIRLFERDYKNAKETVDKYSSDFVTLVKILSNDTIRVIRESEMKRASEFNGMVNLYLPFFETYIEESEPYMFFAENKATELLSFESLKSFGWKGIISKQQRDFYYDSYKRNYPNSSFSDHQNRLALYMAEALVRSQLNMSGRQDYWPSYIQITFVQPIKGLPEGYHNNCVYYRTIPLSNGRTHICPWRAKGYIKIGGAKTSAKVVSPQEDVELLDCIVEIYNESLSVEVCINYFIEN